MPLAKIAQSHAKLLASGKAEQLWLKLDIEAPARKRTQSRTPADVVLVIDCSGSMGSCTPAWETYFEEEIIDQDDPYCPSPFPQPVPYWNISQQPSTNISVGMTQPGSSIIPGGYPGSPPFPPFRPWRPAPAPKRRRIVRNVRRQSWQRSPLDNALAAAREVLGRLGPEDRAAVILYDQRVEIAHRLSSRHQEAIGKLQYVQMGGSTALADALYAGIDILGRRKNEEGRAKMVFLLSDGQANVGDTSLDTIAGHAARAAEQGIRVSTFGLGPHFNEHLMEGIARSGRGTYRYLESAEAAVDAFGGELEDLFAVTAAEVSVDLKALPGAKIERLLGLDAEGTSVTVGDIPARGKRTMLVCCEVETKGRKGELPVVELTVRWKTPEAKRAKSETLTASVALTRSEKQVSAGIDAEVLAEVAAFEAAEAQVQAASLADAGDFTQAGAVLRSAFASSSQMLSMAPDSQLLATKTSELDANIASLGNYDSATAKAIRYQSYRTRNSR